MNYPVAVIIPVYKNDTPQYVRPAIDSIIKQTYSCRIYIGVDGPIGNSLNSCLEAYENNKNVSIVRFAENRGLACVLNDLLQICFDNGYEYIARMDADDISLPDRIEKQICFLNEHPEIDVVGGAINEIDEEGCESGKTIVYPATPTECKKFFAKKCRQNFCRQRISSMDWRPQPTSDNSPALPESVPSLAEADKRSRKAEYREQA